MALFITLGLISRPSAKMLSLAQHADYAQHLSVYAVSCTVLTYMPISINILTCNCIKLDHWRLIWCFQACHGFLHSTQPVPLSLVIMIYLYIQPSRWAPVLWPKTSKTLFRPVNFSVFFKELFNNKSKDLIWTSIFKFSFRLLYKDWKSCIKMSCLWIKFTLNVMLPWEITPWITVYR